MMARFFMALLLIKPSYELADKAAHGFTRCYSVQTTGT